MGANYEVKIIERLASSEICTNKQLALLCDCSQRTIQNKLKEINGSLYSFGYKSSICSIKGKGSYLNIYDGESIDDILELFKEDDDYGDRDDIAREIAVELLISDYLKIESICDKYCLSRSAVAIILNLSKRLLGEFDIDVLSKPHYGLFVKGCENKIRKFLLENYSYLSCDDNERLEIGERVIVLIKNNNIEISDVFYEQVVRYLHIMVIRVRKGHYINLDNYRVDNASFEYIFALKVSNEIKNQFGVEMNLRETNYLYKFVVGKIKNKQHIELSSQENVEKILKEIIVMIKEKYHYDLSMDIEFYSSMSIHLCSLCKRIEHENYSFNPMIEEIKKHSLLAYDIAVDSALLINENLNTILPDDEISYIAIYIHLAISRQKGRIEPKRVLVVCPTGHGMSQLIAQNIKSQFGEYISELSVCGYYDLENIDYGKFDYLFTMKPLEKNIPIPIIEISLNEPISEIEKTKKRISGKSEKDLALLTLTEEDLFFSEIKADDKQQALKELVKLVGSKVKLDENFLSSVLAREKIISTEFDHGYAVPHPLDRYMAEKSFLAIGILEKPITWDKKKIQIILLTYVDGQQSSDLENFYEAFATLITNKEYALRLIEKPTWENMVSIAKDVNDNM